MRANTPAIPISRSVRTFWRLLCLSVSLLPLAAGAQPPNSKPPAPAPKPAAQAPDLWVTVFTDPTRDLVAVAYNAKTPPERIKQDFAEIARNVGISLPPVKVTVEEEIPAAEAAFTGLADWRTGAVNLDPLIRTYKRYGRFRVSYFLMGNFPQAPLPDFNQPPLRVEAERAGNVINYRISIDQTNGVPATVPGVTTSTGDSGRNLLVGIGAIAAVVAVSVFLVVYVLMGQRRNRAGSLERPAGQPGSAAASGSSGEGK